MKINLGLYILGSDLKNIGSISIKKNFNKKLFYSINQEPNNQIIAYITNDTELNPCQDLKFNFKLNIQNIASGFYKSKFDLILLHENKEFDKCEVYTFINIIPLIIKFSIIDEKYSLSKNIVSISHYIKKLKIYRSFPGNFFTNSLGINIINNNITCEHEQNNSKNKGQIIIEPINEDQENINFDCNLSLLSTSLLELKFEYKNPIYFGLKILNEKNIDLKIIKVMKNMKKSFHLYICQMKNYI